MTPGDLETIGRVVCALSGGGQATAVEESGGQIHVHMDPSPRVATVSADWALRKLERIRALSRAIEAGLEVCPVVSESAEQVAW